MKGKKISKKAIAILVIAAIGIGTASYFGVANAAKDEAPDVIEREYTVKRDDITAGVSAQGVLKLEAAPQNFDEIVTIGELFVKTGQAVKAGDKLAGADVEKLDEAIEEAQSELEKVRIALKQAQNQKTVGELNTQKEAATQDAGNAEANSQLAAAKGAEASAQQKVTELEGQLAKIDEQLGTLPADDPQIGALQAQKEALAEELETARQELETARANRSSIEEAANRQNEANAKNSAIDQKIANANSGDSNNAIALAKLDVEAAQKKVDRLQAIKNDPYIYADANGVVLSLEAAKGSETKPDTPIALIGDPNKKRIIVPVAQSDIGKIKEGQAAEFTLDAFGDQTFTGKVLSRSLAPVKDSNPVSYNVVIEVDANETEMLDGMSANATMIIKQQKDVLQLSNKAIAVHDGKQYVKMRNEDGTLREVEIQTGFSDGKVSEITGGLSEGDVVIVEG